VASYLFAATDVDAKGVKAAIFCEKYHIIIFIYIKTI
jgi:hypothetical protein